MEPGYRLFRLLSFDVELNLKKKIGVEKIIPPKSNEDEGENDEIEVRHGTWSMTKEVLLGAIETTPKLGIQIMGKRKREVLYY